MTEFNGLGLGSPLANAGAPVAGIDEVQRITIGGTPSGGTFTLTFDGHTTAAIAWSATNATLLANVEAALEALQNIDGVGVADNDLSSGIGSFDVTFNGANLAKLNVALMTADVTNLTGTAPTVTPAVQTAGVDATHRNSAKGALLIDTTNAILYINTGSQGAPTWTKVGTQT